MAKKPDINKTQAAAIQRDFCGFVAFQKAMSEAAVKLFGSGWAWLADKEGKLEIMPLGNADTPLKHGKESALPRSTRASSLMSRWRSKG